MVQANLDVDGEISRHLEWIELIGSLISSEQIPAQQLERISQHDGCSLGQWLNSAEAQPLRQNHALDDLEDAHARFHELAGALISALQEGQEAQAITLQQEFLGLSQQVILHLSDLKGKAGA